MIRRDLGFPIKQSRKRHGDIAHGLIKRHPHDLCPGRGLTIDRVDFTAIDSATN